jgi:hypothetical protein
MTVDVDRAATLLASRPTVRNTKPFHAILTSIATDLVAADGDVPSGSPAADSHSPR